MKVVIGVSVKVVIGVMAEVSASSFLGGRVRVTVRSICRGGSGYGQLSDDC